MLGWVDEDDDFLDAYFDEPESSKVKEVNNFESLNNFLNDEMVLPEPEPVEIVSEKPIEEADALLMVNSAISAQLDELHCFGCGFKSYFENQTNRCHFPLVYHFSQPYSAERARKQCHAPWYCNSCISCSHCKTRQASKYLACRRCGRSVCLGCYREERVTAHTFSDFSNFVCNDCVECVNCGWKAPKGVPPNLYADNTLCRPCYLSRQLDYACPLCYQIYHNLPHRSDFGDVKRSPDFSLCPMIECDGCRRWVHCNCEGIDEEEYKLIGQSKTDKFYCSNCRKAEPEVCKDETLPSLRTGASFEFRFFNPEMPWKLCNFYLKYQNSTFGLRSDGGMKRLKGETLDELISEFKECFEYLPKLKWPEAVKIETFLNPARLIASIPKHLTDLRQAIEHLLPKECARTKGYTKRIIQPPPPTSAKLVKRAKTTSSTQDEGVKIPNSLSYMCYLNILRADKSYENMEATSLGLALRPSQIAGFGLFATRKFNCGELIIEYCGELLPSEEMVNRRDQLYQLLGARYRKTCYLFRMDDGPVLDATMKGNLSRFINHSCEPNSRSRTVRLKGKNLKLCLFALKDIEPDQEIVFNYRFPVDDGEKLPCNCGSSKCRGFMNR